MTPFDIAAAIYLLIGVAIFIGFYVNGWQSGDAGDFIMAFIIGLICIFWWGPALVMYGIIAGIVNSIQWLMDITSLR